MIEVEISFVLKPEDEPKLLAGAQLIKEVILTDEYFDTADLRLTLKDQWLRRRNGRFELKMPASGIELKERVTDQYHELESEEEIITALDLDIKKSLTDQLLNNGYEVFCKIVTTRREYKCGDFGIDIDIMDYGYQNAEVELLVNDKDTAAAGNARIKKFLDDRGIKIEPVHGKVIEYLQRFRPEHYRRLKDAGVIY